VNSRISCGILGATGIVGQHLVRLLEDHPWFELTWVAASERSAGKTYEEATAWRMTTPMPAAARRLVVNECRPESAPKVVFSALDAPVARDAEPAFAQCGHIVVSNASAFRMAEDVPLLVPEVNADHVRIAERQSARGWKGRVYTNPNCSAVGLTMALGPIERAFGLKRVVVTTMQAVSGAGYPGVASMDALANVIPYIRNEEEKLQEETQKILGRVVEGKVQPGEFPVSAACNRVMVLDGHTESVSIELHHRAPLEELRRAWREFRGVPQERKLPSAPQRPVIVLDEPDRPQPRLDVERERGMAAFVGRARECPVFHYKFIVLSHNTVRGAAGAALLNAELLHSEGLL
jgi:aspartate-semialdehyde dehydrogenase